MYWQLAASSQ